MIRVRQLSILFILPFTFCNFYSSTAQELIFKSGFEGTVSGIPNKSPVYFTGSDDLTSEPNDWTRNLDNFSQIGAHTLQYEGGNNSHRYAQIVNDPTQSGNKVLKYWMNRTNSSISRVQSNIYGNKGFSEFTQQVSFYLHPDFKHIKSYSDRFNWLTLFEFWNNANFSGEKFPFRVSVNIKKTVNGSTDAVYFHAHGQEWGKGNGMTSLWEETNTSFAVPFGEWLTATIYYKEGRYSSGKFEMVITRENGQQITVFDLSKHTRHPDDPNPDGVKHFNPMKLYTFKKLIDHVRNRGGALEVYWDDFSLWKGDARIKILPFTSLSSVSLSNRKYTYTSREDAYTNNTHRKTNYDDKNFILVRNRSRWGYQGYFRFSTGKFQSVKKAKLRLYGRNPLNDKRVRVRVFGTSDKWHEESITYNNAPSAQGGFLDQVTIEGSQNRYYEWDVTDYVNQQTKLDGNISFTLVSRETNAERAQFFSREAGGYRPELIIEGINGSAGLQSQAIDFPDIKDRLTTDKPFYLSAKASSGLKVSYSVISGPASTSGNKVTLNGKPGKVIISAFQSGNGNFQAANAVIQEFYVEEPGKERMYISPIADAEVESGKNKNKNYGSNDYMQIRNKEVYGFEVYLKFDLKLVRSVSNAKLRIHGSNPSNNRSVRIAAYKTSDNWDENKINFSNRPKSQTYLNATVINATEKYYEIDVTSLVKQEFSGDKIVSFVLKSTSTNYERGRFNTREHRFNVPELLITGTPKLFSFSTVDSEVDMQDAEDILTNVFPNPFTDNLRVELNSEKVDELLLTLVNLQGKAIYQRVVSTDIMNIELDQSLSSGVYILQLSQNGLVLSRKKLVKRE